MKQSAPRALVTIATVALCGAMAGCASAVPTAHVARDHAQVLRFDAPREDGARASALLARVARQTQAAAAKNEPPAAFYPPEIVHQARIELAREALDADNTAKAEAEEAEQMQRDIAEAHTDGAPSSHTRRAH